MEQTYFAKQDVHWEGSSWNVEYGYIAEKCSKLVRVHGCGGDYEFQVCASGYNLRGEPVNKRGVIKKKDS